MLSILCTIALGVSVQDLPNNFDSVKAHSKMRALARIVERREAGLKDYSRIFDGRDGNISDRPKSNRVMVILGSATGYFDRTSNDLLGFWMSTDLELQAKRKERRGAGISREEAEAAFQEYWDVLNPGVKTKNFIFENKVDRWEIQGLPDVGDTLLLSNCAFAMYLDTDRGQLLQVYQRTVPDLTLARSECVSQEAGEASALEAYSRFEPFAHGRVERTWKSIGVPSFMKPNEMTEEHHRLGRENKAVPLYVTCIEDADAIDSKTGKSWRWQFVYVDARDGHAVHVEPNQTLSILRSEGQTPPSPFLGQGAFELVGSVKGASVRCKTAGTPKSWPEAAGKVVLKSGRELWSLEVGDGGLLRSGKKDSPDYWTLDPGSRGAVKTRAHTAKRFGSPR